MKPDCIAVPRACRDGTARSRRRGNSLIEFTLIGMPVIFVFISIVSCSIDMWQFLTLSYAVDQTARYASLHGATCSVSPNACQITRADVATYFQSQAQALAPASTTMTLNDGSGLITCNPVTACPSSGNNFPVSGNDVVGSNNITVTASYSLTNPIVMFFPAATSGKVKASVFTVSATSEQQVLF